MHMIHAEFVNGEYATRVAKVHSNPANLSGC